MDTLEGNVVMLKGYALTPAANYGNLEVTKEVVHGNR